MTEKELHFIETHKEADVDDLLLHPARYPDIDVRKVAVQLRGLHIAKDKLPLWASTSGVVYPEHLSLEQCSSEPTASYKAKVVRRIVEGSEVMDADRPVRLADLTGGFGVDAIMMHRAFDRCHLTYIERDAELCRLANHNFPLLGVDSLEVVCANCEDKLKELPRQDIIFIDPSRRDDYGRKTVALSDCKPDITILNDVLLDKAGVVVAKLSPMIDIALASKSMKGMEEVHVVSLDGECKEVLLVLTGRSQGKSDDVSICCCNIHGGKEDMVRFSMGELRTASCRYTTTLGRYLYEPNASVMKANAMNALCARYELEKLHPNSHLFTSDKLVDAFNGRKFEIQGIYGFNKRDIKTLTNNVQKANITVRNLPLSVADLRKRLKLKEGGGDYLFATTLADNSHILILAKRIDN